MLNIVSSPAHSYKYEHTASTASINKPVKEEDENNKERQKQQDNLQQLHLVTQQLEQELGLGQEQQQQQPQFRHEEPRAETEKNPTNKLNNKSSQKSFLEPSTKMSVSSLLD